jgi:FPC/CPF motif-containing protein YcgG
MADLNRDMVETQKEFFRVRDQLRNLFGRYDDLYREINRTYVGERQENRTSQGLEDFYRLLQTIRRNRDVIGSLTKGFDNFRPTDKFHFEEIDETAPQKKRDIPRRRAHQVPSENVQPETPVETQEMI